ncbi:MAG: AEC family transporter [Acidobacteriota bacterium]
MLTGHLQIAVTVLAFALVVGFSALLRNRGVLRKQDAEVFARLLTQAVLPVVIFSQLIQHPPSSRHLLAVLAMFVAGCVNLAAAHWLAGMMHFSRPRTGALMIVSSFGSSSLLGYPIVQFAFPDNPEALTYAILISEVAVGLPIFTICPIVAMQFGEWEHERTSLKDAALRYVRSPIFLAVALGLVLGTLRPPLDAPLLQPVLQAFQMISGALAALSCLILGLQMEVKSPQGLFPMLVISVLLQLVIEPLMAYGQAIVYGIDPLERRVLVLVACMPSAVLGTVFATRYKCEGEMASAVAFMNIVLSLIGIPLVFALLGR